MSEIAIDDAITLKATVPVTITGKANFKDAIEKTLESVYGYPDLPEGEYVLSMIVTLSPKSNP